MIILQQWNLGVFIFLSSLFCGNCDSNIQEINTAKYPDHNVDPHSFNYDKHTKKYYRQESPKLMIESTEVQLAPSDECNRAYNECINGQIKEIPDEYFSRRIINLLLARANLEKNEYLTVGSITIELKPSELKKLQDFGAGKATIRDIDPFICDVFKISENNLAHDIFSSLKYIFITAIIHKDIVLGSLFVLYMIWTIRRTKWTMLKLFSFTTLILLVVSFVITWLKMLKDAEVQLFTKQTLFMKLPIHCQPHKMSWWDKVWAITASDDSCRKHYESMTEIPFLQVTPLQVMSHMMAALIVQPMQLLGHEISDFSHQLSKNLSWPLQMIFEPVFIIVTVIVVACGIIHSLGASFGIGLGPFSLFPLNGIGKSKNNGRLNNEKREPIEVILNVKLTHDNKTLQSLVEAPKENEVKSINSTDNGKTTNKSIELDTKHEMKKLILHNNPASGDSNSLNTPLSLDVDECARELKKEEIVMESGSGDN